jgi:iron(III) transport system ATP-binding protein
MSLVLENIRRRFGATAAVDGADLAAGAGEITCLFGPSGCGKTTLLRVAAGFERPETGRVALDGALLSGDGVFVPPERRPIGFVFQEYVLFPHLNAARNVAFGLADVPRAERRRRAEAELAAAGLDGFGARYPHELSGGQQQRVALARALARRPKAMLLDEPFAAIDAALRARLRDDVRRLLKAAGAATILVTHDPEEALALADRVAIMRAGRIIECARPQELFETPRTPEGAALFPGAQSLAGAVRGEVAMTAFGPVPARSVGDGPARLVLLPGAARIAAGPGPARVLDVRFRGPDWRVDLQGDDGKSLISAASLHPVAIGAAAGLAIEPALVRVFRADV